MSPRRVAVLTTGRQDYGILRSTLLAMQLDPRLELRLWVGGMHLSDRFGHTVDHILADGFTIDARLDFLSEPPALVVDSARVMTQVQSAIAQSQPDALVLLGDRSETLAAGVSAALLGVPIVHLHGGEETEGAVDNQLRHALTKLSALHLVSHETYAQRVRQMGEADNRVHVVGAPGLDNLFRDDLPSRAQLETLLGLVLHEPVILVTMHPTTLNIGSVTAEVEAVASAMEQVAATWVITEPNSDLGGEAIRAFWHRWARGRARTVVVKALGELNYFGLLGQSAALLGNSSSGLIEAPALGLPVVNVGDRQKGRLRSAHVMDVVGDAGRIHEALERALEPELRERLRTLDAPFPRGKAAPRIAELLATAELTRPPRKAFVDRPERAG